MTSNSYLFPPVLSMSEPPCIPEFASAVNPPSLGRYWRTLRHLRPSQLLYLVMHRALGKNDLSRWGDANVNLRVHSLSEMAEWQPELARQVIRSGEVRFVLSPEEVNAASSWWGKEVLRRQMFNANYCDFLNVDLTSAEDFPLLHKAVDIALTWCEQNATGQEFAWQPFSLSMRIPNWLKFLVRNSSRASEIGDGDRIGRLLSNLRLQVLSLESRLERELLANHFLKNTKALLFAGFLLDAPESRRWRDVGQQILGEQITEQILPDGGHIERSPMYHAWVLDDLLEIQQLFKSCTGLEPRISAAVSDCVASMARYLQGLTHPDGEIPLLNDSQLDITRPVRTILSEAGFAGEAADRSGTEVRLLPDTGYATIRDNDSRSFMVFDCGPLGPNYQPGHGHSDVLTYELSLYGQRVIVDTGVSSYEPGPERHYERSTAAHNTVRIDGVDQAEIWGSFRVGARPTVSRPCMGQIAGGCAVTGHHSGYKRLHVEHSRAIGRLTNSAWIIADALEGKGRHRVESFIHFHPAVQLSPCPEAEDETRAGMVPRWMLQFGESRCLLMTKGDGVITLTSAWYAPSFAIRVPQSVVHWSHDGNLPVFMAYALVPEGTSSLVVEEAADQLISQLSQSAFTSPRDESNIADLRDFHIA